MSKLHDYSVLTFHKILKACMVYKQKQTEQARSILGLGFPFPLGHAYGHSFRLSSKEAPVMVAEKRNFFFCFLPVVCLEFRYLITMLKAWISTYCRNNVTTLPTIIR